MSNPADLTILPNVKGWLALTGVPVAAISQTDPAVVTLRTQPDMPIVSGFSYTIQGATGLALPNDAYVATVIDPLNFSIPFDASALNPYTGGAFVAVDDTLLARLITSVSVAFQTMLSRRIAAANYAETRNGTGTCELALSNFPALSVSSLTVNGITVQPRPALGTTPTSPLGNTYTGFGAPGGYVFDAYKLYLTGGSFWQGAQNVAVNYSAGFEISNEPQTIPASAPYTLTTIARWSAGDRGVAYANGTALVAVSGAPGPGQYSVAGSEYTFNAADAGAAVLISYGYVPFDLEQAVIDTLGDWFKYIARIGKTTQSIEQQTTTFVNTQLPARAQGVFNNYRRTVPVWR